MLSADLAPKLGTAGAPDRPPGRGSATCGVLGSQGDGGRRPHRGCCHLAATERRFGAWVGAGRSCGAPMGEGGVGRGGAGSSPQGLASALLGAWEAADWNLFKGKWILHET